MLTKEQIENIKKFMDIFNKYTRTKEYKKDMEERKRRLNYFKTLTKEKIQNLTELDFGEIISMLWASRYWINKEYLVNNIISSNGIDKIRKELYNLFYGNSPPEKRYERFMNEIKELGPSSITEMLSLIRPDRCGIWNDKARKALKILGFDDILPLGDYKIDAEEYKKFNEILKEIAEELKKAGHKEADAFFVDYYLYEVQRYKPSEIEIKEEEFDHDEIRDALKDIGSWLGFDADIEKQISQGAVVDVVWKTKIGNLGVVTYVFEVQKRGSIDSLILNLQKAIRNKTVQKVVAISDEKQLEKIRKEIADLPENFREMVTYLNAGDVKKMHEYLSEVNKILESMELVKGEFEFER